MPVQDIVTVLQRWFPYTAGAARAPASDCPTLSKLLKRPELESLAKNPDITPMLGAARMLSGDSLLPDDHMFTAFLQEELVSDMLFLFDSKTQEAYLVIELGPRVCGHAKVVHGGLLSAICDETYGALIYSLKHVKELGPEPAVTANLSVNFRKPVPTSACVICKAKMVKREGRKMFLEASLGDVTGQPHYADSQALFINLKADADSIVKGDGGRGPLGDLQLKQQSVDPADWNEAPRYNNLLKDIGL